MPIRKMTAEERDQLFGEGVVLPLIKPMIRSKAVRPPPDKTELKFIKSHRKYGDGFSATLMNGPSADLFEIAGLEPTSELLDAVWGNHNWKSLLEECPTADIIETGAQDHTPGMSDVFFWVAISDLKQFKRELRAAMLAVAQKD